MTCAEAIDEAEIDHQKEVELKAITGASRQKLQVWKATVTMGAIRVAYDEEGGNDLDRCGSSSSRQRGHTEATAWQIV